MLDYLFGKIIAKHPASIVLDAGGMGFIINIPLSTYNALGKPGDNVRILTVLHIREDAWNIYGFASEEERGLFGLLITVSGVGPKSAIAALSGMSASQIRIAIASGDIDKLTLIPGIGKKTAQRLVVELKDKVKSLPGEMAETMALGGEAEEALLALEALGFPRAQAEKAVERVLKAGGGEKTDEILRKALNVITKTV